MTTKKITLNAEKRKVIADQFQSFYEDKVKDKLVQAKEQYDLMRVKSKRENQKVVRYHQPQEDIDTIRRLTNKYGRSGGELYEDNCFYVRCPITKVDDEGEEYEDKQEINVRFHMGRNFARAYYRDEMKAKGLNPDFHLSINDDYSKRNPKYYNDETAVNNYLGFSHTRNDATKSIYILKMNGKMILNFGLLVLVIVIQETLLLMKIHMSSLRCIIKCRQCN